MRVKLGAARLPLTAGCAIPGLARLSDPADRRRQPDTKPIGRPPGRRPRKRRIDHPVSQILTVGPRHVRPPPLQRRRTRTVREKLESRANRKTTNPL